MVIIADIYQDCYPQTFITVCKYAKELIRKIYSSTRMKPAATLSKNEKLLFWKTGAAETACKNQTLYFFYLLMLKAQIEREKNTLI